MPGQSCLGLFPASALKAEAGAGWTAWNILIVTVSRSVRGKPEKVFLLSSAISTASTSQREGSFFLSVLVVQPEYLKDCFKKNEITMGFMRCTYQEAPGVRGVSLERLVHTRYDAK